jgi:hypothetical protein
MGVERQVGAEGATWIDRELLADAPQVTRDAGFGREVTEALARHRQWLIEQELARAEQDSVIYRANLLGPAPAGARACRDSARRRARP